MALFLRGRGQLQRFDCSSCDEQRWLGCGEPPILDEAGTAYDHEAWLAYAHSAEDPSSSVPGRPVTAYYWHDIGQTRTRLGLSWAWPQCPQSYILHASPAALTRASALLERVALSIAKLWYPDLDADPAWELDALYAIRMMARKPREGGLNSG